MPLTVVWLLWDNSPIVKGEKPELVDVFATDTAAANRINTETDNDPDWAQDFTIERRKVIP